MNGSIDRLLKETDLGKVRVTADHAFLKGLDHARYVDWEGCVNISNPVFW